MQATFNFIEQSVSQRKRVDEVTSVQAYYRLGKTGERPYKLLPLFWQGAVQQPVSEMLPELVCLIFSDTEIAPHNLQYRIVLANRPIFQLLVDAQMFLIERQQSSHQGEAIVSRHRAQWPDEPLLNPLTIAFYLRLIGIQPTNSGRAHHGS